MSGIRTTSKIWGDIIEWIEAEVPAYSRADDPCLEDNQSWPTRRVMHHITEKITEKFSILSISYTGMPQLAKFKLYYDTKNGEDLWNEWDDAGSESYGSACELFRYPVGGSHTKTESFLKFLKNDCGPDAITDAERILFETIAQEQYYELLKFMKGRAHTLDNSILKHGSVVLFGKHFLSSGQFLHIYDSVKGGGTDITGYGADAYAINYNGPTYEVVPLSEFLPVKFFLDFVRPFDEPTRRSRATMGQWLRQFNPDSESTPLEMADIINAITATLASDGSFTWPTNIHEAVGGWRLPSDGEISADSTLDLRNDDCVPATHESFLHTVALELINEVALQLIDEREALDGRDTPGRRPLDAAGPGSGGDGGSSVSGRNAAQGPKIFDDVTGGGNSNAANRAQAEAERWDEKNATNPEFNQYIKRSYYTAANCCHGQDPATDGGHWGAAFVSYAYNNSAIKSNMHKTYMITAKNARDRFVKDPMTRSAYADAADFAARNYFAFRPTEKAYPAEGDLCCAGKNGSNGWDAPGDDDECDIFVGNNKVISGDTGRNPGIISIKDYHSGAYSMIISKGATIKIPEENS
jgi:hypothetical protein